MRGRPRIAHAALALATAGLAAGCFHGPSRDEFEDEVRETRNRVNSTLARTTQVRTGEQLLARLEEAATEVKAAGEELDSVGAPDEIEQEAEALVSALRFFGDEIDATHDALASGTYGLPVERVTGLTFDGFVKVQRALAALKARGVQVEPLRLHSSLR